MSGTEPKEELKGLIRSQTKVLAELHTFLQDYLRNELPTDGRSIKSGLVVAGVLENYYTAAETVLFRIVQEFGNEIDPTRWHADILDRLSYPVQGVRPRVLSEHCYTRLDELRRFRHFKRYYYRVDYDWDKLEFLIKKQRELHPTFLQALHEFTGFLDSLA